MGNQWSKNRGRQWSSSWSAPLELIDRSSINDADLIGNLRWSLSEGMRWDERAVAVKDIICTEGSDQANNLSKAQQEERYQATLELLDNVLHDGSQSLTSASSSASASATKAKESVKSLFTSKSSEQTQQRSSSSGTASTGSLKDQASTTNSPPSSGIQAVATTLLPPSSSKLFGAAACKFVISSLSQGEGARSSWLAGESRSKVSQAMSAIQKTIASTASQAAAGGGMGGGGVSQQPIISGGQSGQESNVLPAQVTGGEGAMKSMLAFPHDDIVEQYHTESMHERVEIACKYIYLSSLMKSLSHSTAWCYQLHEKIKWFDNSISDLAASFAKGNRPQFTHAELHKKQMELAKDRVHSLLEEGLKNHDRWRCVLRLFYRDFELCLARHKLMAECARWYYCRDHQRSAAEWALNETDEKINTLNAQKQPLDLEIEKNERDALSVGLAFLDKNLSGSLEAEESPELNAKLFRMLDLGHRAAISYTDLHSGVLSIQEKLENITARIQVLQQQNEQLRQRSSYASYQSTATSGIASPGGADSAVVIQNEVEIDQLKRASTEYWNNLQQIYSAFFSAFAESVFPSVQLNEVDQFQNQALANGDQIVAIIDHISKMSVTDPLISMQTKLQRGDVSFTAQASLDAAIIAQSQQMPVSAGLEAAQTTPLTIPMALTTTPATQHRPPSTFEQTTKPKSEMEIHATEKAVDASKRELHRQQQLAERPSGAAGIEENISGVKDVHGNVQAERERAREKASEMRTSQLENVPHRADISEKRERSDRPVTTESSSSIVHQRTKEPTKEWGTQTEMEETPKITRQTPLVQTRVTEYQQPSSIQQDINQPSNQQSWTEKVSSAVKSSLPTSLGGAPSTVEYSQQKDLPSDEQQQTTKYQGGHLHQQWPSAGHGVVYQEQPMEKSVGEQQWTAGREENISGRDYVEKPSFGMSSERSNIPQPPPAPSTTDYDKYQQQQSSLYQAPAGGFGEQQQSSPTESQSMAEKQMGYGGQGGVAGQEEQYWTPSPTVGTEKGIAGGYSQQKETQFSADPSLMQSSERSDTIPQSPERQSKSWTESIKDTVRSVTGGSQTGTH